MPRTNQQEKSNKRSLPSRSSSESEPKSKIRKTKNSDTDFTSYSSRVFKIDTSQLLVHAVMTTYADIFFNYQHINDKIIEYVLKQYQRSLMKTDGALIDTHAKMHLDESIQYKRNLCKVVAENDCQEMYLCVHSHEFTNTTPIKNNNVFVIDDWLVYRCSPMKTRFDGYKVFQTLSTMIGNSTDEKSFHWFGKYQNYCIIRQLERTVSEVIDQSKDKSITEDTVSHTKINEELAKTRQLQFITLQEQLANSQCAPNTETIPPKEAIPNDQTTVNQDSNSTITSLPVISESVMGSEIDSGKSDNSDKDPACTKECARYDLFESTQSNESQLLNIQHTNILGNDQLYNNDEFDIEKYLESLC